MSSPKVTFMAPIESMHGKITSRPTNGAIHVHRQKTIGTDAQGHPIKTPVSLYLYHLHQGEWSEGAKKNRNLFRLAQLQTTLELNDEQLRAEWIAKHEQHKLSVKPGERFYPSLRGFVSAAIHTRLKQG